VEWIFKTMSPTPNSDKKTLILTGASRGIGHATVKRFSSAGWRVITCSRHPFPENCPWEMGPDDHIQVDLGDPADTERAVALMKTRLQDQGGRLNALVNNAAISPKGDQGTRLGTIETKIADWQKVFLVNFFAPVSLARGLIEELDRANGAVVNVSSIAGSRVHPFAGAAYATRNGARFRSPWHPRQLDFTRRNRHLDPVPGHGQNSQRTDPDASTRRTAGSRQSDLFPLHGAIKLR
jgi:NADP-dependent 3-hydroxy acid dehydrogenase YdfG